MKWLTEKYIEEGLDYANLSVLTGKYNSDYREHRYELVDEPKKQPNRIFLHEDLEIKIIMDCRTPESCKFKRKLGFKLHDVINTKHQTIIGSTTEVFERENMQSECSVLSYRFDIYFHEYKLAIEIDEYGHENLLELILLKKMLMKEKL